MKTDSYIRVTKLKSLDSTKEASFEDGYWVEGILEEDIKVDNIIKMFRWRNSLHPQGRAGQFTTTFVKEISKQDHSYIIKTENSLYKIEEKQEPQGEYES